MRTENSGGDVLAKGGVRCQFRTAGSKVTAEQWAAIWEPEVTNEPKDSHSNSDAQKTGDAGADTGASVSDATGF